MSTPAPGGRRSAATRRIGPGAVLGVLAPVVTLVAALLLQPSDPGTGLDADHPATQVPLEAATLVCPGGPDAAAGVTSLSDDVSGTVTARDGAAVGLAAGRVAEAGTGTDAAVLDADGPLSAGLVGTRSTADPLSAAACRTPTGDQWFTGVGAAAEHSSVLELVNPDAGPAVADVTVWSATGPVDVPALRGVAVEPGSTSRFDLSQVVPRRGDLSLRVQVVRGRLGASVLDREDPLGDAAVQSDWLPPQAEPATRSVLLGLTRGEGSRTLAVANPGDDEVVVTVQVVSPRATFTPEGLDPLRVPPQSTSSLDLDDLLADASRRGAVGLLVEATGPVTSALRQVTGREGTDLSLLAPEPEVTEPTGAVVPTGSGVGARLVLAGGSTDADVTVVATGADGAPLATREVALAAGTADNVALPRGTVLVTVDPGDAAVRGAVLVQRPGATVLPLTPVRRTLAVPDVRPGLP